MDKIKIVVISVAFVVGVACSSTPEKPTESATWNGRMQGFAQSLYTLFPLASDPAAFKNPENYKTIDDSLTSLAVMSNEMSKSINQEKVAKYDPAISVLAGSFGKDLGYAADAFRKGDYEYARSSARGAIQLCIQCHARKPNDQNRMAILDPSRLEKMKPLYRADWYAAARHFDESLATYQEVLNDQSIARNHAIEWQQAAQRALAIAVRAKGDPDLSEKIVNTILKSTRASHYFLTMAQLWKEQIHEWKSNSFRIKMSDNDYEKAKTLVRIASRKDSPFPQDYRNSYIYYLRASSYLHTYLEQAEDQNDVAKAYLLLGQCYEALKDPGEVGLSQNYYKTCILASPHSETATQCYDRYEENVFVDSVSEGTSLSPGRMDYLSYLKKTAMP